VALRDSSLQRALATVAADVQVRPLRDEHLHRHQAVVVRRHDQGRVTPRVRLVDVGARLAEPKHDAVVAARRSLVQGRHLERVLRVDIVKNRARAAQAENDGGMAARGALDKRRAAEPVHDIQVRLGIKKRRENADVVVGGSLHDWSYAIAVGLAYRDLAAEKLRHFLLLALLNGEK